MARQRFIWPTIWTDPVLGKLKETELLFYIGCFSTADDEGKLLGDPAILRGTIFPYSSLGVAKIKRVRDSVLARQDRLCLYNVGGVEYLRFENWSKWQKPKYPSPSHFPDPPEDSGNGSGNVPEVAPPELDTDSSSRADDRAQGWVGLGRDGVERAKALSSEIEDDPIDEQAIQRIYAEWRTLFNRTHGRYSKILPARRLKIRTRLREFTVDELLTALRTAAADDWAGRAKFTDIDVLFRSQQRVEDWLQRADTPSLNGHVETDTERAARIRGEMVAAQRRADESLAS